MCGSWVTSVADERLFASEPERHSLTTPDGTSLDVVTSALQKAIRRGEEAEATYWALQLERAYPWHLWRRLAVIAVEDIGLGNPNAIVVVQACRDAYVEHGLGPERRKNGGSRGRPDGDLVIFPVLLMCRSAKNREADHLKVAVDAMRADGWRPEIGDHVLDIHTAVGKERYAALSDEEIERLWFTEWSKVSKEVGPYDWRDWHWRRLGIEDS
jgi:replication-associated recombination protein RarA